MMSVKTATVALPELSGPNIRLSPTEAIRAAMDLHDPTIKVISLRGHDYYPFSNKANCRTFSIGPYQFITQNPEKKGSKNAELAKLGHKLTWIVNFRHWGLIQDGKIVKKSSLIDLDLSDWVDTSSTISIDWQGSGPTKRAKMVDVDKVYSRATSAEIKRTYSDPTQSETTSLERMDTSITEESVSVPTVAVPASVSQYIIRWPELKLGPKLGSGAFGDVKKAVWRDTPVAVKLLHSMDATTEFFQEAGLLCSLRHPNIVSCLGVCAQEPNLAIVMELMSGNLTQLIQSGPIPLKVYLPLAIGIARGIAFLHQRSPKVIHRDLKPENILLDANGVPKLGDFGVSKESLITMTQTKIGTPSFAAPELLNSEAYGTAADIYSMSMVMYCMATGVSPFGNLGKEGPAKPFTPLQIMMKVAIQRERPIIPASVNPVLSQLIKDCWDHFPKKRPTATELLSRLVQLEESLKSGPYSSFADSASSSTSSIASDATIPLTTTVALEEPAPKMSRARAKVKTPASTATLDTGTANMSSYTSTRTLRSRTRSQAAAAAGGSTTLQLELPEISMTKGRKRKAPGSIAQIKEIDEKDEDWAQSDAHKQLVYQLETEETKRRWAEQ